jgi:CRP-like cAMP-binding protein
MMQQFGTAPAFFVTSILFQSVTVPIIWMLTMPFLTPLSPESRTNAKENWEKLKAFAGTWKFAKTITIATLLYPAAGLLFLSPKALEATAIPTFAFWPTYRALVFSLSSLEILYYGMHRLMHWTGHKGSPSFRWLNKVHRVHHLAHGDGMMPLHSTLLHDAELICTMGTYMVGPLLWRAHPALYLAWGSTIISGAALAHTSYMPSEICDHIMHHQRSNCNYGLFGVMDHLCKTTRSKSVDGLFAVASMYRKQKGKRNASRLARIQSELSAAGKSCVFQPGETVIRVGDEANSFFVLERGTCDVIVQSDVDGAEVVVKVYDELGEYFGELSLLRKQPRAATIKAGKNGCKLIEISDEQFSLLSEVTSEFEEQATRYEPLASLPACGALPLESSKVRMISDLTEQVYFEPGEAIIVQGEIGDKMYILEEGDCAAYVDNEQVRAYKEPGDFFGELALLYDEPRKATIVAGEVGASVAVVTRPVFDIILDETSREAMRSRIYL